MMFDAPGKTYACAFPMGDPFPTGLGKLDLPGTPRGGGSACPPAETNEGSRSELSHQCSGDTAGS